MSEQLRGASHSPATSARGADIERDAWILQAQTSPNVKPASRIPTAAIAEPEEVSGRDVEDSAHQCITIRTRDAKYSISDSVDTPACSQDTHDTIESWTE